MAKLILNKGTLRELDVSRLTFKYKDLEESPIYVHGENEGTSKAGTPIWDRVRTRYSANIPLVPMTDDQLREILAAAEVCPQTVEYETARGTVITKAAVTVSGYRYAMELDGERLYHGAVVTIEEE